MPAVIVETGKLAQVIGISLAAGLGLAVIFSLGISGTAGLIDALRTRRTGAAAAWGTLTALCALATVATIVLGIVVMAHK